MKTAVYAGSFDPPTMGHSDILWQTTNIFDKIVILVATNPEKKYLFSEEERIKIWSKIVGDHACKEKLEVAALPKNQYTLPFVYDHYQDPVLVRGIRNIKDLEEEKVIRKVNNGMIPGHSTIYFLPNQAYEHVSSTLIKGLLGQEGWEDVIYNLVPIQVLNALREKFK